MTYAPATIRELATYLVARGFGNLGIVGDQAHALRASYHNGRDRILAAGRLGDDYSVIQARDRAGLTDAASALDVGPGARGLAELRRLSVAIAAACQAGAPGTADIREVIYSPDGIAIRRWDAVTRRTYVGGDGTGQGDDSHRTHTHVSWYRDSEHRSKLDPWRAWFGSEDEMIVRIKGEDWQPAAAADGTSNGVLRATPDTAAAITARIPLGTIVRTIAELRTGAPSDNDWRVTRAPDGTPRYLLRRDWSPVTAGGDPLVDEALVDYVNRAATATAGEIRALTR